jgi:phosphate transport system protein
MSDHTVKAYDAELHLIGGKIAEMGGVAEKMLVDAMDALAGLDVELAHRVLMSDPRLDNLQREIEEQAVKTIARRQPMANDLRELVASIHIAGDLERAGDLAKNIAKRAIKVADDPRVMRAVVGLKHMAEIAALQLKEVLDAYAQRDVERARAVWLRDAELDALEDSIFRDLLTFMMEDPRNISFCAHLLFCTKNLERVGDHATNIAENVFFMVTGSALPMNRPKGDV